MPGTELPESGLPDSRLPRTGLPEIELYEARVPMRRPFRHAAKARTASSSVLVAVRSGGVTGWGESAPREYVTGETVGSVLAALSRPEVARSAAGVLGLPFDEALAALAGRTPGAAPAAAAGLETALLDHLCRREGVPGFTALHRAGFGDVLAERQSPAPVATVLDLGRDPVAHLTALPGTARAAIPHLKLKAGPDPARAAETVARVRPLLAPGTTVSVDANCAWRLADVLACADALLAAGVSWLEEPLTPRDWTGLAALRRAGLRVMLDESFVSVRDLAEGVAHEAADLVNLRVSKCGGPLSLLTALRAARRAGLGVQLGVQVGEVGPLWAAGRLISTALPYAAAVEAGRQDEWFPPGLTAPPYAVDRAASRAPALTGPGIGLTVTPALLALCEPRGPHSQHPTRSTA
ncbi:enolase C-terminal domain-like protein [Streptomyces sp. NPDC006367]|uniref:enolase C-terminal domain-like protein n=1 Tax=unclassified Streptomyces TaxID=2593676 RepID=UPI0033BA2FA3